MYRCSGYGYRSFGQYSPILAIRECTDVEGTVFRPFDQYFPILAIRECAAVQGMVSGLLVRNRTSKSLRLSV